eukprot:m.565494 g.565494  ORF g.565494 m.565494 type:complete len:487 (-) comp22244_c0_seq1:316-1776(-)
MGAAAVFGTKQKRGQSAAPPLCESKAVASHSLPLRDLLESDTVEKVMWDCRSDCSCLWHVYGVKCNAVVDLQLLQVAVGINAGYISKFLPGLGAVLARIKPAVMGSAEAARVNMVKREAHRLFSPHLGGRLSVWLERPLRTVLLEYASDVCYFHRLRESLNRCRGGASDRAEDMFTHALRTAGEERLQWCYGTSCLDEGDRNTSATPAQTSLPRWCVEPAFVDAIKAVKANPPPARKLNAPKLSMVAHVSTNHADKEEPGASECSHAETSPPPARAAVATVGDDSQGTTSTAPVMPKDIAKVDDTVDVAVTENSPSVCAVDDKDRQAPPEMGQDDATAPRRKGSDTTDVPTTGKSADGPTEGTNPALADKQCSSQLPGTKTPCPETTIRHGSVSKSQASDFRRDAALLVRQCLQPHYESHRITSKEQFKGIAKAIAKKLLNQYETFVHKHDRHDSQRRKIDGTKWLATHVAQAVRLHMTDLDPLVI